MAEQFLKVFYENQLTSNGGVFDTQLFEESTVSLQLDNLNQDNAIGNVSLIQKNLLNVSDLLNASSL